MGREDVCSHEHKENSMFVSLVSGGAALIVTLVFASFTYTWSEVGRQDTEKKEWRKEHQEVLDKRFQEIKENQKELASSISQSNDKTQKILEQLLEEQRKLNIINMRKLK